MTRVRAHFRDIAERRIKRRKGEVDPRKITDFGTDTYDWDSVEAFFWAWKATDHKLLATGNWWTEDAGWWAVVYEMDAVYGEIEDEVEGAGGKKADDWLLGGGIGGLIRAT